MTYILTKDDEGCETYTGIVGLQMKGISLVFTVILTAIVKF